MQTSPRAAFLLVLSLCTALTAQTVAASGTDAESTAPLERTGPYVAVAGGVAAGALGNGSVGVRRRTVHVGDLESATGSIGLRAGYRVHRLVAAELQWDYQTGWDFRANAQYASMTAWNLTANLKGYLTDSAWRPFVVTGIGLGRREIDTKAQLVDYQDGRIRSLHDHDNGLVARAGAGLEVEINSTWSAGSEVVYVIGTGDLGALDYATMHLVVTYSFF